jgi:beta-lactamase regulating signal transducer with metallopeptidase domain/tetratricopeptide (TPR) repeat protein
MSFRLLSHSPEWTGAGWTMLHLVWVGAVAGVLAALSRRLTRRAGPEIRHATALFWLIVLAGSPAAIFVCVFQPRPLDTEPVNSPIAMSEGASGVANADSAPAIAWQTGSGGLARGGAIEAGRWSLEEIVPYLPMFWLTGSLSAFAILTSGLIGVHRLRQSSRIIAGGEIPRQVRALADSLRIARRVSIGVCDRVVVPALIGVIRPLILLPPAALCGWSTEQLEMVLLHELAHLRRWDNLVNILQRVVESLLFFHPVVWWLSGWLRLERELCCDRLVVSRVGRPVAYAEMLVAMTGRSHQGRSAVLAMADRDVLTRIRRLFNLEERSMKLTLPEGIGLLGALILGTSLVFALEAAQQEVRSESPESVRQALQTAAGAVNALPRQGMEHDFTVDTLANIARAQMKLGDRPTALATLRMAYESIDRMDKKKNDLEVLGSLTQVAKYQRELGDLAAARKTLIRMVTLVDSLESRPFVEELVQVTGTKESIRKKHEIGAVVRCELLLSIAEEQLALGERDLTQATCRRALKVIESKQDMFKPMALAYIAMSFYKAGDHAGARNVMDEARRFANELPEQRDKERSLVEVARALAETGDFVSAIQLVASLDNNGRQSAIERIVESFTEDEAGEAWLPISGIKITIGAPSRRLKDREAASIALPKLVQAATAIGDPLYQARSLSLLAHLQAKLGKFADAVRTTESIPAIKRKDFPGPSDGFYDAIKPATPAIVAQLQFEGGEKARGHERLLQAVRLSRAIETADQKIVSQIVIIRKLLGCHDLESAKTMLTESISLARQQPEPFKSRSLVLLLEAKIQAGDPKGAEETIELIRAFPGLERVNALNDLAAWYKKKGDHRRAEMLYRRALACILSKMPPDAQAQMGKAKNPGPVAMRTFVDSAYELAPAVLENQRQMSAMFLYANLGEIQEAAKVARSMSPYACHVALGNLAGSLARDGRMGEAMKLVASIESPEGKLTAYDLVAIAIRDGRTRK